MEGLEEQLRNADISNEYAGYFLKQVQTFRAQLNSAFAFPDVERILNALELMIELHLDQAPRPDGTPYIEHPLDVASQVLEAMAQKDPDVVVAALLHDAVEDQPALLAQKAKRRPSGAEKTASELALDAIEELTQSARVREMISGLTNPDFAALVKQKGILKGTDDAEKAIYLAAKNALYAEHVREAIRDPDVAIIKLFDFAANSLKLDTLSDATIRTRLRDKYIPVVSIMLNRLRDTTRPLNITSQKEEEMLSRFSDVLLTYPGIEGEHVQNVWQSLKFHYSK